MTFVNVIRENSNKIYYEKYKNISPTRSLIKDDNIKNFTNIIDKLQKLTIDELKVENEQVELLYSFYLVNEKYINKANEKLTKNTTYCYKTIFEKPY